MKGPQQGNGSGKFEVGAHDMGGWVRVKANQAASRADDIALYLAHRLSGWLREQPHRRILCIVPINRDGNTVELHAWYDQHLFQDISPLAAPQQ